MRAASAGRRRSSSRVETPPGAGATTGCSVGWSFFWRVASRGRKLVGPRCEDGVAFVVGAGLHESLPYLSGGEEDRVSLLGYRPGVQVGSAMKRGP